VNLLAVLPLAIVMVAGPQIISAILVATSQDARRNSLAFVAGVALAITVGTMVAYWLTGLVKTPARGESEGTVGTVIDWLVIVLLVVLMVRIFTRRKNTEPPKWMGRLQTADVRLSFRLGLLLFLVMPTDVITMLTVGAYLARHGAPWWHSLPFLLLTLLLAGLPLLVLLLLGRRAQVLLPRLRDWMNTNSWVVSEVVIVFFLVLTISGMGD
jgi:threonine/homoserine/homoserine lactone efflux protein